MKILVHSCPGYNSFIKELIRYSGGNGVSWSVLLYSNADRALEEYKTLVGEDRVLYLQEKLGAYMDAPAGVDLESINSFPGTIFECVSTSKVVSGHKPLLDKPRDYQLKLVSGTYKIYKEFLNKIKPDFVLFPLIELYDAMVLYRLCGELGIKTVICAHARNLGVSYFSDSMYETLPSYAKDIELTNEIRAKAKDFVSSFRKNYKAPSRTDNKPHPGDIIPSPGVKRSLVEKGASYIAGRIAAMAGDSSKMEPNLVDQYTFFHRFRIHFLPFTLKIRRIKGKFAKTQYDIKDIVALPSKFIYYPLQYTPEVSINVPAPFFLDQERAIDLILGAIPADHYLVVKEHPAMEGIRPASFYKRLKRRCNLLLADYSVPSIEVTKRAALTVSVTGTACLEAFLLGKPSLNLSRNFFTDWVYKFDSFDGFKGIVREAIDLKEVPAEKIEDLVARTFAVSDDFVLFSPTDPYLATELVMNRCNIALFLKNLLKHIEMSAPEKDKRGI